MPFCGFTANGMEREKFTSLRWGPDAAAEDGTAVDTTAEDGTAELFKKGWTLRRSPPASYRLPP